jgi:preprotein translocase subunit SecE
MKKIIKYIKESYNELVHKVSWPTRAELSSSAVVVLVASIILSLLIFVVDLGFENVMKFLYNKVFAS